MVKLIFAVLKKALYFKNAIACISNKILFRIQILFELIITSSGISKNTVNYKMKLVQIRLSTHMNKLLFQLP